MTTPRLTSSTTRVLKYYLDYCVEELVRIKDERKLASARALAKEINRIIEARTPEALRKSEDALSALEDFLLWRKDPLEVHEGWLYSIEGEDIQVRDRDLLRDLCRADQFPRWNWHEHVYGMTPTMEVERVLYVVKELPVRWTFTEKELASIEIFIEQVRRQVTERLQLVPDQQQVLTTWLRELRASARWQTRENWRKLVIGTVDHQVHRLTLDEESKKSFAHVLSNLFCALWSDVDEAVALLEQERDCC
jgi:hypothetical protein